MKGYERIFFGTCYHCLRFYGGRPISRRFVRGYWKMDIINGIKPVFDNIDAKKELVNKDVNLYKWLTLFGTCVRLDKGSKWFWSNSHWQHGEA